MLHFRKIPKKNGEIWRKFSKIWPNLGKFAKFWKKKTANNSAIFNGNFEIRERCKGVHCVDLGESFPTSIYLQNRRRYSRERAPRSLRENSIHYSLHSLAWPAPRRRGAPAPRTDSPGGVRFSSGAWMPYWGSPKE